MATKKTIEQNRALVAFANLYLQSCDELKIDTNAIVAAAHFCKSGNAKLGKSMYTFSKLAGRESIEVKKLGVFIAGSCGEFCKGCGESVDGKRPPCYVFKSYRYPSVVYGHAKNTLAMRASVAGTFAVLRGQLERAKKKPAIVRINQSGELESVDEFRGWCMLAKLFPEIKFYIYTKNYGVVIPDLLAGLVPANFTVNFSIWNNCGIAEYNTVKHLPNVKAFVCITGFDYSKFGIVPGTYCMAYATGKLNHKITCELCRKCIDGAAAVVGCNEHD